MSGGDNKQLFVKQLETQEKTTKEAEILAHVMGHPNVITLHHHSTETCKLYFEYASGGDLQDLLDEHGFAESHTILVMRTLLKALCFLHKIGIVHRDLKPSNLVFMDSTDISSLKIADFGISTFLNAPGANSTSGTRGYQAPEVYSGKGYGMKVDVFSVGVIAYCLLFSDRMPFGKEDSGPSLIPLVFPDDVPLSPLARDFLSKLLEFDPEKRPTAEEASRHPWLAGLSFHREQQRKSSYHDTYHFFKGSKGVDMNMESGDFASQNYVLRKNK